MYYASTSETLSGIMAFSPDQTSARTGTLRYNFLMTHSFSLINRRNNMPIQHLLLASDGNDRIIDAETLEDELVITPPLHTSAGNVIPNTDHYRVAVKKHYCRGKIYAVALDRHVASNEIDDAIDLHHPEPIE